jgi:hypothetical protein
MYKKSRYISLRRKAKRFIKNKFSQENKSGFVEHGKFGWPRYRRIAECICINGHFYVSYRKQTDKERWRDILKSYRFDKGKQRQKWLWFGGCGTGCPYCHPEIMLPKYRKSKQRDITRDDSYDLYDYLAGH